MRDYVLKVAQDKKQELLFALRDKLIEGLRQCAPTREAINNEAGDLYIAFAVLGSSLDEVDTLVEGYQARVAEDGDMGAGARRDALETVKRILEL